MANVYAIKSGNWSDVTVWNTGALPTMADDVWANGFTITADTSSTVLSVRNTNTTGINAGGVFTCSDGTTINATGSGFIASGTTTLISFGLSSPSSSTFVGNFSLPNLNNIINSGSGTLTLQGNVTNVGGTIGNSYSGSVRNSSNGTINIIGNIVISVASYGGAFVVNTTSGTINITGNIFGPLNGTFYTVYNTGSGTIIFTGSMTGGTATAGGTNACIFNVSSGIVTSIGTCTGGSATSGNAVGFINNSTGTFTHIGSVIASTISVAIGSGSASQNTYLTGPFIGTSQGVVANAALKWRWHPTESPTYVTATFPPELGGGNKDLYTADTPSLPGQPLVADVRKNVIYGPDSELSGTLVVPPPSQVLEGVPTDDTVGQAGASIVWNVPLEDVGVEGSIAERIKNCATIQSVGDQIAALGG